jgi:hypothetical protein
LAEHVACVGQKINGHKVLVGRAERRKRLGRRSLRFVNNKRDLRMKTRKLDLSGSEQGPMVSSWQHGNKKLPSIKCTEFLKCMSNY